MEDALDETASIAIVARRNGVAPNLPVSLAASDAGGEPVAVSGDDDAAGNRAVRQTEDCIRELERISGAKPSRSRP